MHRYRIQLAAAAALVALTALPAPRALATSGAPSARPVTEKDPFAVVPVRTTFDGAATVTTGAAV